MIQASISQQIGRHMKFQDLANHATFKKLYTEAGVEDIKSPISEEEIEINDYRDIEKHRETFKTLIEADIKLRQKHKEDAVAFERRQHERQFNDAVKLAISHHVGDLLPKFQFPEMKGTIQRIITTSVFRENKDKFKIIEGELIFDGEKEEVKQYATEIDRLLAGANVLHFNQKKQTLRDVILKHASEFMCMAD